MKLPKSFTALDFETFTPERSSACSIGLVKVVDGEIVKTFYSLINPIPDDRKINNSRFNGITPQMVESAPTFAELWKEIKEFVNNDVIVSHNTEFDKSVWNHQLIHYGLANPESFSFLCTFELTGLSLSDCCRVLKIDITHHHNALDDAIACANVMLAGDQKLEYLRQFSFAFKTKPQRTKRKVDHETLKPLSDGEIENKSTPFFHAKTVITGVFMEYPDRNELAKRLQSLGADINTSISKRTNIVVMGQNAGPTKVRKINELNEAGCDIRVIYEKELIEILGDS